MASYNAPSFDSFNDSSITYNDLYSQYMHIGNLMGSSTIRPDAYDPYNEDLLRSGYREDFRSMVSGLKNLQRDQIGEGIKVRSSYGKAGFAGSGGANFAMSDLERQTASKRKDIYGDMQLRRERLSTDIQAERKGYQEEIWDAYSTWLSTSPSEDMMPTEDVSEKSKNCYEQGGYYDASIDECVLPQDFNSSVENWMDT